MIKSTYFVIVGLVAGAALYALLKIIFKTYFRFRGQAVVTCPETQKPAGVAVDAKHAAIRAAVGVRELRLQECTRWPERQNCGQECLAQIEASPQNCLLRKVLAEWYKGKSCVYCKKEFGEINWHDHKPALRSPSGDLVEWSQFPPETLSQVLKTHSPVCWNCLIAEDFRHRFPDLVVDRPPKKRYTV